MTRDDSGGRAAATSSRAPLAAVLALTAVSAGGAAVSRRSGLSATWSDAVGPDGHLSVPLPMTALQVVAGVAAGSSRRAVALTGSGVLAASTCVAVVSGLFDGGYADHRLATRERAYQGALVVALVTVGVVAASRLVSVWRGG